MVENPLFRGLIEFINVLIIQFLPSSSCRSGMPRELVPPSRADEFGVIHLARDHTWGLGHLESGDRLRIRSTQDIS